MDSPLWSDGSARRHARHSPENVQVNFIPSASGMYTVVVSSNDSGHDATGDYLVRVLGVAPYSDLQLTKLASVSTAVRGEPITFTLTVTNNGPDRATNVRVTDIVPSSLAIVSCTATGGGVCASSGNTRTITYAGLAAGATGTISIATTVQQSAGSSIVNTATVTSGSIDDVSGNNASGATIAVSGTPTQTDADADGLPGDWETQFGLEPAIRRNGA